MNGFLVEVLYLFMVLCICRHVRIWIFGIMARLQIHRLWVIILVQLPLGFVTVHCYSQFISMDAKLSKTDDHKATESVDKGTASKTSELRTVAKPGPNTVAPAIGEKVLFQSTFGGEAEEFRVAYVPQEAAETADTEIDMDDQEGTINCGTAAFIAVDLGKR